MAKKRVAVTDDEPTPTKETPAAKPVKIHRVGYEVVATLNMGRKADNTVDTRTAGEIVYEDELGPEMTQYLLGRGEIVDHDKPLPPSQAQTHVAFDHLLEVAKSVGAVKVNGGEYRLAGEGNEPHKGVTEFRKHVTIEQLKTAIVEAAS